MNWNEVTEGSTTYHELWDGERLVATVWTTETGKALWVDHHGAVWRASSLESARRLAEERANERIRVEVA